MPVRVREHQELDDELEIDHAAGVVLEVEKAAPVRVRGVHLFAHREDFAGELAGIARAGEDPDADRFERFADLRVPRAVARAGEGLVLPGPGRFLLIFREGLDRRDEQPRLARGTQAQVGVEERARSGARGEPVVHALREARVVLGRALVRVVVEENEVEVGGVPEFLAAELAVADHGEARRLAVPGPDLLPHVGNGHAQGDIGKQRQVVGEALDGEQARQVLRKQPEHLPLVLLPEQVHLPLGVALGAGERLAQARFEARPVGRRVEQAVVEQLVEQQRVARDEFRRPARGADHLGDALECLGVLGKEREVGGAARDRLDEIQPPRERRIRVGGRRGSGGKRRDELVHPLARRFGELQVALARPEGGRARVRGPGAVVVVLQVRLREHVLEMARDRLAVGVQGIEERIPRGEIHHQRNPPPVLGIVGQHVRLRVVEVLQPVLDAAQENVGAGELAGGVFRKKVFPGQLRQDFERRAHGKRRIAPAAHELQRLGDELDFADAAGTELDVRRELAPRDFAPHLGVQPPHRRERPEIEVLAVDERPHDPLQLLVPASGDGARLDPGIALPFAPLRDEIGLERVVARGERPGLAVGPQAHVDAERKALAGGLREKRDQLAAGALERFMLAGTVRIDEHQVHVGGDVELAAAELAHADHDQLARGRAAVDLGPGERAADLGVGERAHRAADLGEFCRAREVARHHAQEHAPAQPPQACLERALVIVRAARQRQRDLVGAERMRRVEFRGEPGMRREQLSGVARKGDFPNGILHLRIECPVTRR